MNGVIPMSKKNCFAYLAFVLSIVLARPAAAQLANRTADEWIATLESPTRIESLKIYETLGKLAIKPGQLVADIGAGTGIFSIRFSSAVKPGGKVYAVDVDQKLLDHILEAATEQGIVNVVPVLGEFDDPALPDDIDLAFINDVLHHIEHRELYLKNLAAYLKPNGRVAIIDFKPGQGGHANQPELQVSQEQVTAWMAAAGLKPVEDVKDLFTDKWFVIYAKQ
jgi:ubiquinone/menaquinone biosynthesis C-methylase UbiE